MRTELVTDALGMAIIRRQPEKRAEDQGTVLHSESRRTVHVVDVRATPAEREPARLDGHCWGLPGDNAMMESVWVPCNSSCSTRTHGRPGMNLG